MSPENSQLHHQAPTATYEGVGGNDGRGNTLISMLGHSSNESQFIIPRIPHSFVDNN